MRFRSPRMSCSAAVAAALLLFPFALRGQITVASGDWSTAMKTGTRASGFNTPAGQKVSMTVGMASTGAQTWDFRSLPFAASSDFEVIDPATAPEHSLFPAANAVLRGTVTAQPGTVMYQYNQITPSEYLLHAVGYTGGTATYQYKPPAVQMRFPCTIGTTWTYVADATSPVAGVTIQTTYSWSCDAHGTLRLPGGDYPALRLLTETVTVSQTPLGRSMLRSFRYNFVTKTLHGASVSIDSTDRGKSTVTASAGYQTPGTASDAGAVPSRIEALIIGPVYPQPVRSETVIPVTLARAGHLRLSLVDLLGREVALLAEGSFPAGTHAIPWYDVTLSSGQYLCVARSGKDVSMRPVTILR
ncbi:MAG: hypothetical protein IPP94_17465 [Ignavibacteria bacterium]|nr:hypothetical protein [Ignavibacteria bacterium]